MEKRLFLKCLGAGALSGPRVRAREAPEVDCAFPGGNIIAGRMEGDEVFLRQDLRDTQGHWFYWYFRVRGAAGRTLTFRFTDGTAIGVRGPAVSSDGGRVWKWLGRDGSAGESFRYSFPESAGEVRFCVSIPYLESNLNEFLAAHRSHRALQRDVLCKSRKGREVELLRLSEPGVKNRRRALITARHHCCETIASYSMEGLMTSLLAATPTGNRLRRNVEFVFVPFMDKDGVEDGDQGKNRTPHDHNRDYFGESIYPSVRALRELAAGWPSGELVLALDMHCPGLRGRDHEKVHFVGGRDESIWREVLRFSSILERVRQGPLPYRSADNLPYGAGWNTAKNTPGNQKSFGMWASELPGIRVAGTIEIPYANAGGVAVTAASARALGADLARALLEYFDSPRA